MCFDVFGCFLNSIGDYRVFDLPGRFAGSYRFCCFPIFFYVVCSSVCLFSLCCALDCVWLGPPGIGGFQLCLRGLLWLSGGLDEFRLDPFGEKDLLYHGYHCF
jgi:hypothetical protein